MERRFLIISVCSKVSDYILNSIIVSYLLDKGLNFTHISLLLSVFMLTSTLVDFPTGGLADKYGRRRTHALGLFISGISYILLLTESYFSILVWVSYVLKGISASQISGSLTSWLNCYEPSNSKFVYILKSSQAISIIINIVIGLFLYQLNIPLDFSKYIILFCALFNILVSILTMVLLKENYGDYKDIKIIYKEGMHEVKNNSFIKNITFISAINYILISSYMLIWQPILLNITNNIKFNFISLTIVSVGSLLGLKIYKKLVKTNIYILLSLQILLFILFALSYLFSFLFFFFLAMFIEGVTTGIGGILVSDGIKKYSTTTEISTLTSLISSISMGVSMLFQLIFGIIIDYSGLLITIYFSITIAMLIFFVFLIREQKQ